jgi:sterol desaturase/sphingolipid hydroxylase (fatty acid hydroxylase superfamily)
MNTDDIGLPQVQAFMKDWTNGMAIFVTLLLAVELLLRIFEWWDGRRKGNERNILPNDAIVNLLTTSIYNLTLRGFGFAAMFGAAFVGYKFSHWRIPLNWWTLPAYILAAEFHSYFFHRLMHEMRIFWADHSVHHSSEEFDFTTFQRFHLLEWVPKVIVFAPLAMIGFHPMVLFLFTSLTGIQLICHTARFGRWGWWDRWFVSPTIHGVHHARNPIYMDRNLGGASNLWDHIFGTYQNATEERPVYGITHSPNSNNIFKVLFWEYSFLARDFIHAPGMKAKLIVLFGRPGETFEALPARPSSVSLDSLDVAVEPIEEAVAA